MNEAPEREIRSLRFLRALVTTLMLVMIAGFIVLIGLLVTRFPESGGLDLPNEVALPAGVTAEAFTTTTRWYAIVTASGQILVYDRSSGALLQTIEIVTPD